MPRKFILAFRQNVESGIQDPTNKGRRTPSKHYKKNIKGGKFTEATRIEWDVEGVV